MLQRLWKCYELNYLRAEHCGLTSCMRTGSGNECLEIFRKRVRITQVRTSLLDFPWFQAPRSFSIIPPEGRRYTVKGPVPPRATGYMLVTHCTPSTVLGSRKRRFFNFRVACLPTECFTNKSGRYRTRSNVSRVNQEA